MFYLLSFYDGVRGGARSDWLALCAKSSESNRIEDPRASTHGASFVFRRLSYLVDDYLVEFCAAYVCFVVCRVRACFFTTGLRSRIVCELSKNDGLRKSKGDMYRIVLFSVIVGTFLPRSFFSPCFLQRSRIICRYCCSFSSPLVSFTHELGAPEPGHFGVKRKDPFFFRWSSDAAVQLENEEKPCFFMQKHTHNSRGSVVPFTYSVCMSTLCTCSSSLCFFSARRGSFFVFLYSSLLKRQ